jgi:hypothetical protein
LPAALSAALLLLCLLRYCCFVCCFTAALSAALLLLCLLFYCCFVCCFTAALSADAAAAPLY